MVGKLPKNWQHKRKAALTLDEVPFGVEVTVGAEPSFYRVMRDAVDEGLSSLGESAKEAVYFHLEKSFRIRRSQIPLRIDDFSDGLDQIFGLGARHLEILIMKSLNTKVQIECEWGTREWVAPELTFKEYVRMSRRNFDKANRKIRRIQKKWKQRTNHVKPK